MHIDIPLHIFGYHPSLQNSTFLFFPQVFLFYTSFQSFVWAFTYNKAKPPTNPLRPVMMDNARSLRITAAAGTKLAGAYSNKSMSLSNLL
jgi:hypothetical protein